MPIAQHVSGRRIVNVSGARYGGEDPLLAGVIVGAQIAIPPSKRGEPTRIEGRSDVDRFPASAALECRRVSYVATKPRPAWDDAARGWPRCLVAIA
jgi:hypothetical protein